MRYRSRLIVNLSRFSSNIDKLKLLTPKAEILAMIKADAYGHGAVHLLRFAFENHSIREFGLATLAEALHLRKELPDFKFEAYVFSDSQISLAVCQEWYQENRIIPVISSLSDLNLFLQSRCFRYFPLVLKFNTGMNRLGIDFSELVEAIDLVKKSGRRHVDHLMTHLANASLNLSKNKMNIRQVNNFNTIKDEFRSCGIHIDRTSISNSGAIEQAGDLGESHIRPGLMLFGPSSLIASQRAGKWTGEMISSLETYIIQTYPVQKGTPVGYGASPCPHDGLIAVIALGYGDGLSNRYRGSSIKHRGFTGKFCGRVNMDMAQILFPPQAKGEIRAGERVTIWDSDQESFLQLCDQTETIPYEIFCQLSSRVPRIYRLE